MNCDRIARLYQTLEYCAFGKAPERRRFEFIPEVLDARRVLILGEGDGRFAARLCTALDSAEIDCIELSGKMIDISQSRMQERALVRFHHGDACTVKLPHNNYDLVVTNFFFDCFAAAQLAELIPKVASNCAIGARWIVSEFERPACGWKKIHANLWLKTMYLFFRLTTGLRNCDLPRYADILKANGFRLQSKKTERAGLIASEFWTLEPPATGPSSES